MSNALNLQTLSQFSFEKQCIESQLDFGQVMNHKFCGKIFRQDPALRWTVRSQKWRSKSFVEEIDVHNILQSVIFLDGEYSSTR
jgi:hypothetical protein